MTGRDPLGPDGWDGERPTPPADQVDWTPMLELLPEVDDRRDAPPDPPQEPFKVNEHGVLIIDFSSLSSPAAGALSWVPPPAKPLSFDVHPVGNAHPRETGLTSRGVAPSC